MAAEGDGGSQSPSFDQETGGRRTDGHGDGRQEGGSELVAPGILADVGHGQVGAEAEEDAKRRPELPPEAVDEKKDSTSVSAVNGGGGLARTHDMTRPPRMFCGE